MPLSTQDVPVVIFFLLLLPTPSVFVRKVARTLSSPRLRPQTLRFSPPGHPTVLRGFILFHFFRCPTSISLSLVSSSSRATQNNSSSFARSRSPNRRSVAGCNQLHTRYRPKERNNARSRLASRASLLIVRTNSILAEKTHFPRKYTPDRGKQSNSREDRAPNLTSRMCLIYFPAALAARLELRPRWKSFRATVMRYRA